MRRCLASTKDGDRPLCQGHAPESLGQVPTLEPSGNRRRRAWLVFLLLVVFAVLYGVWQFYPLLQVNQGSRESEKEITRWSTTIPADKEVSPVLPPPVAASPAPVRVVENLGNRNRLQLRARSRKRPPAQRRSEAERDQASEDGWLSLTGIVKERTWLRITIDGKEEKEYLFQPGSRPQWRARKNFTC